MPSEEEMGANMQYPCRPADTHIWPEPGPHKMIK